MQSSLFDLTGKVAVITGSSRGLGLASARAMAEHGARVVISGRKLEACQAAAADIVAQGGQAIAVACNIGRKVELQHLVDRALGEWGRVDIVMANAAIHPWIGSVLDLKEETFNKFMQVNVQSSIWLAQMTVPGMLERGHGVILNMASVASSLKGVPSRFVYSATKAAVIGMTRSVAADYVTRGVRANCLCPGTVQTPSLDERIAVNAGAAGSVDAARAAFVARQPMGRLGSPEEIAALAVYLASDAAQFITGQAVVIDGGLTL